MHNHKFSGRSQKMIVSVSTAALLITALSTIVLAAVLGADDRPKWDFGGGEGTHIAVGKPSRTSFGEVRIYHDSSIDPLITIPASDAQDGFGIFTSAVNDMDGDGFDDLVVGAPFNNSVASSAGAVFVYSSTTGQPLLQILGEGPFVELGRAVCGAEDLSGDGVPDILACGFEFNEFGEPLGCVRVYSGQDGSLLRVISSPVAGDGFGFTLAVLPDLDGDGIGDIAIGAPIEDLQKTNGALGRVYVFTGASIAETVIDDPITSALFTVENDDPDLRYFGVVVTYDDDAVGEQALIIGGVDPESLGPDADIIFNLSSYELVSGAITLVATAPPKIVGDVTGDGVVDDTDVQLVMSMLGTFSENEPFSGDANSNGIVLADDVAMVISSVGAKSPVVDLVPNASPILSRIFELTSPAGISGTAVSDGSYSFLKGACIIDKPRALGGDCGDESSFAVDGVEGSTDISDNIDGLDVTDMEDSIDATDLTDGSSGGTGSGSSGDEGDEGSDCEDEIPDCDDDTDYDCREVYVNLKIYLPKSLDISEPEIELEDELLVGSQTWLNIDNDDRDEFWDLGTMDTDVSEQIGSDFVSVENDLVKLSLTVAASYGTARLTATDSGGQVLLWYDERKLEQYTSGSPLDIEEDFVGSNLTLWAEGVSASVSQRDVILTLTYTEEIDDGNTEGGEGSEGGTESTAEGTEEGTLEATLEGNVEDEGTVEGTAEGTTEGTTAVDGPIDIDSSNAGDDILTGCDRVSLTVLAVDEIQIIGNGNSIEDTDNLDSDPNWPAGLSTGSLRVFPGARFVGGDVESSSRDWVDVVIVMNVVPIHDDTFLTIRSIDMDDPSSETFPVDSEASEWDDNRDNMNRFYVDDIYHSGSVLIEVQDKETHLDFQVPKKPGDNIRFAASISHADALSNPDPSFDNDTERQYIVDLRMYGVLHVPAIDAAILYPESWTSKVLTVWRNAWIEIDSAEAVDFTNIVDTSISEMATQGGKIVELHVAANLSADGGIGRFESGSVVVGPAGSVSIVNSQSGNNGSVLTNNTVSGFEIWPLPFEAVSVNDSNYKMNGQILNGGTATHPEYEIDSVTFTGGPDGGWTNFVNGQLSVSNGQNVNIEEIEPGQSILPSQIRIPVQVQDDDMPVGSLLRAPLADRLIPGFEPAYINIRLNELPNPNPINSFLKNNFVGRLDKFDTRSLARKNFWVRYLYTGFQGLVEEDYDPSTESPTIAVRFSKLTEIFLETRADYARSAPVPNIVATNEVDVVLHELGHTFGCEHIDNGVMGGSAGEGIFDSLDFSPYSINKIRNQSH